MSNIRLFFPESLSLKFWYKISAAGPGIVSKPASVNLTRYSFGEIFDLVAP